MANADKSLTESKIVQELGKEMQRRSDWIGILLSRKEALEADIANYEKTIKNLRHQLLFPTQTVGDKSTGKLGRPVCVHFHIFKNAGTTVDWALEKNFGESAETIDRVDDPDHQMSWPTTIDLLSKRPNIKSISSHQFKFPLPRAEGFNFIPMVFIRHPIDRAISVYHHAKRETNNDYYNLKAKDSSVKEFIQFNLESEKYVSMKNLQTILLAGQQDVKNVNSHTLYQAIENLTSSTIKGTVERLDETLVLAEEALKPYFPTINLAYVSKNISPDRFGTVADRLNLLKSQIGNDLYKKLEDANKLDFLLHQYANEELDIITAQIDNFKSKLVDFKKRCSKLGEQTQVTYMGQAPN